MTNGLFYMSSTLCYISTCTLKRYSLDYANSVFPFLSSSTNSLSTVFISSSTSFFLIFVLFIFGCTGSSLLHAGFPTAVSGGYSCLGCSSFLSQWLLLLQSTGSRHSGFGSSGSQPQLLHSMWTLLEQGSNPCSLRSHADSHPLHHLGSPRPHTFLISYKSLFLPYLTVEVILSTH